MKIIAINQKIDTKTVENLIKGVKEVSGSGIVSTTVTAYKVATNEQSERGYGSALRSALFQSLKNGLNATQVLDTITSEETTKYFVVVGGTQMIEELISEAHKRSLIMSPRKWIVILVEPIHKNDEFWDRMNPIFSVTPISVARREVSAYSQCNELREGCQMRLAFETLRDAIKKVIELPVYDFNDTKQVKAMTKNRVIAEMKVSLIFSSFFAFCVSKILLKLCFNHSIDRYFKSLNKIQSLLNYT